MKPLVFCWLIMAFFGLACSTAHARPKYAVAEGVSCAYCHVNPKGSGPRNYRGNYYARMMHSFAGFNDAMEAKTAGVEIGPEGEKTPKSAVPLPPPPPRSPFVDPHGVPDFGEWTSPDGIVFIKIPAGVFTQGMTDAQKADMQKKKQWSPLLRVEQPARPVTISRPFLISKTEVSQKQWDMMMVPPPSAPRLNAKGKPIKQVKIVNPSAFKNGTDAPLRPVETVSWNDAKAFCRALRDHAADGDTGNYRLPTEAEWEYAARAGSAEMYPMGADKKPATPDTLGSMTWMNQNATNTTHPVGTKQPNAWGLYDMTGGVWEWCEDAYSATAYRTLPPTDPVYQSRYATERVMRGGCWFLDARAARVSLRSGNLPDFKSQYVGFRIVREL